MQQSHVPDIYAQADALSIFCHYPTSMGTDLWHNWVRDSTRMNEILRNLDTRQSQNRNAVRLLLGRMTRLGVVISGNNSDVVDRSSTHDDYNRPHTSNCGRT